MKNANLHARLAELRVLRDDIDKQAAPLEAAREKAFAVEMDAVSKRRAISEKIAALKDQRYRDVSNEIAALTRALGTVHVMKAEGGSFGVKGTDLGKE